VSVLFYFPGLTPIYFVKKINVMNSKYLILAALMLSESIGAMARQPDPVGRKIYEGKCTRCHGRDGTRGLFGAKNLQTSKLDDKTLYETISEGRRIMPSWKEKLKPEEIHQVIRYVKTLRPTYTQP
jgi:cytochrome c6